MRKVTQSGFDSYLQKKLRTSPTLAREYAAQFAELPLGTQLAILRRRRLLSQEAVAKKLNVAQPHVARVERPEHDPRLSSVVNQTKAIHCRLIVVPEELLSQVAQLVADAR